MEVWGGSAAFDSTVTVPGNSVRVRSEPFEGGLGGGDIYYVSNCAAGLITRFVLADIAGHGERVAGIALELRRLMRLHINTADQTRFAVALNRAFAGVATAGTFATAVLATYFAPTDHMIICNAGHPRPLLFRAAKGGWELLDARTRGVVAGRGADDEGVGIAGLPLGILDPTEYEQFAVPLEKGDLVVLYTDAFIEAADAAGSLLGEEGLLAMAGGLSEEERGDVAGSLHRLARARVGGGPLDDDATVIVLTHNAENPPREGWKGRALTLARLLGLGARDTDSAGVV